MSKPHSERAHSKFSASGAERWFACPGSVALSEGQPDKSSPWAEEGTRAHEVLEAMMLYSIAGGATEVPDNFETDSKMPPEMIAHARNAANFILKLHAKTPNADLMVETRIYLDFIHAEMFGTFDSGIVDLFGTLHVFDFKYGAGHSVRPKDNLQMIFYGIGLANRYDWNFKRVRLWIIQPRIKGYDGPTYWDIPIAELEAYVPRFVEAVEHVEAFVDFYEEGSHCHWCKAKSVCPLKVSAKLQQAKSIFGSFESGEEENKISLQKVPRKKAGRRQKIGRRKTAEETFGSEEDF